MELIISLEAIIEMLVEYYKTSGNLETGGILLGPESDNIVKKIIPSTYYAERKPTTYYQSERDVRLLNEQLRIQQKHGLIFKGYFHSHPSGMFNLSHGDKNTCKNILEDQDYKINNNLLMFIITESRIQKLPIFAYTACLNNKAKVIVTKLPYSIMPTNCINTFLKKGKENENINAQHNSKRTSKNKSCNIVRDKGSPNTDCMLTDKKEVS